MHTFMKNTLCVIEDCTDLALSRTLCGQHYMVAKRSGQLPVKMNRSGVRFNTGCTTFKKGEPSWNKGIKNWASPEHILAIKKSLVNRSPWNKGKPGMSEENNPAWKGNDVGYRTLHKWVEFHMGIPDVCIYCKTSGLTGHKIHWANISHHYKRDKSDWMRLCAKCHKAYDTNKLTLEQLGGYSN